MKISKKSLIAFIVLGTVMYGGTTFGSNKGVLFMTTALVIYAKRIPLSRNSKKNKGKYFALVGYWWYDWLNIWKWQAHKSTNVYYATRSSYFICGDRKRECVRMHRVILNLFNSNIHADHIDHNGLNNLPHNIRRCTPNQNHKNKTSHNGSSSKFLGVSWQQKCQKWMAQIECDGKIYFLGRYKNELDAAASYDKKAFELFGEFANLNCKNEET